MANFRLTRKYAPLMGQDPPPEPDSVPGLTGPDEEGFYYNRFGTRVNVKGEPIDAQGKKVGIEEATPKPIEAMQKEVIFTTPGDPTTAKTVKEETTFISRGEEKGLPKWLPWVIAGGVGLVGAAIAFT